MVRRRLSAATCAALLSPRPWVPASLSTPRSPNPSAKRSAPEDNDILRIPYFVSDKDEGDRRQCLCRIRNTEYALLRPMTAGVPCFGEGLKRPACRGRDDCAPTTLLARPRVSAPAGSHSYQAMSVQQSALSLQLRF